MKGICYHCKQEKEVSLENYFLPNQNEWDKEKRLLCEKCHKESVGRMMRDNHYKQFGDNWH